VLHFRVTDNPTAGWIIPQLREAFAYDAVPRCLVLDNDKKYGPDVLAVIEHMGIRRKQITPHSPWPSGVAERWVVTVRRDRRPSATRRPASSLVRGAKRPEDLTSGSTSAARATALVCRAHEPPDDSEPAPPPTS